MGPHLIPPITIYSTLAWDFNSPSRHLSIWINLKPCLKPKLGCLLHFKRIALLIVTSCQVTFHLKNNDFWLFYYFGFYAICPFLALKCHFEAFLAEWWLLGCFDCLIDGESGPWGKDAAPGLKMSPTIPKTDSGPHFYYILKFSI